jgi:hypothetical protein
VKKNLSDRMDARANPPIRPDAGPADKVTVCVVFKARRSVRRIAARRHSRPFRLQNNLLY